MKGSSLLGVLQSKCLSKLLMSKLLRRLDCCKSCLLRQPLTISSRSLFSAQAKPFRGDCSEDRRFI
ncbi:Hypothetical protein PMT_2704 [Prochlorococcus marinus str. MIT 9313]|uniref:Uncharacterized protein n=1 Tax=Prochlorococcus marinus (strain MIT 9313) TaxID=74547 RepID=B9ES88_PROMM|nr:Hypothetical protein PMT_2704 [Prochlorococcus marinus str. MIT 9313]